MQILFNLILFFQIGPNPIGLEGLKLVFAGVCADRNAVVELDFSVSYCYNMGLDATNPVFKVPDK